MCSEILKNHLQSYFLVFGPRGKLGCLLQLLPIIFNLFPYSEASLYQRKREM